MGGKSAMGGGRGAGECSAGGLSRRLGNVRQGYLASIAVAAARSGGHFSLGETQKISIERSS